MKYYFEQVTFKELLSLRDNLFYLGIWKCINEGYEKCCYKVLNNNCLVALLLVDESCSPWTIVFEVHNQYRSKGVGKNIILQYLSEHPGKYNLFSHDEEVVGFWKKCGFYGDKYEMWFDNSEV